MQDFSHFYWFWVLLWAVFLTFWKIMKSKMANPRKRLFCVLTSRCNCHVIYHPMWRISKDRFSNKLYILYCGFQWNANSEIQNPTYDCVFRCGNYNYGDCQRTTANRNKQNGSKSNNHNWQTWPFDLLEENFCFPRGSLRWLTAAKSINRWSRIEFQSLHFTENRNRFHCNCLNILEIMERARNPPPPPPPLGRSKKARTE